MYRFAIFACYVFLALLFYNLEKIEAKCLSSSANKTCRQGPAICPACIDVSWLVRPPFSFQGENITEGVLPGNLKHFLNGDQVLFSVRAMGNQFEYTQLKPNWGSLDCKILMAGEGRRTRQTISEYGILP